MSNTIYRYHNGDVLRLCHSNPLIPAGDYALLDVDDTVVMARLIHSARGTTISKKRVYVQITDMCLFEETGRTFHVQSGVNRTYFRNAGSYLQSAVAER